MVCRKLWRVALTLKPRDGQLKTRSTNEHFTPELIWKANAYFGNNETTTPGELAVTITGAVRDFGHR